MSGPRGVEVSPATVRQLVTEIVGEEALVGADDDEPLFERRLLDSLNLVTIMAAMEERFNIQIASEDLTPDNFRSIDSMTQFVSVKQARR